MNSSMSSGTGSGPARAAHESEPVTTPASTFRPGQMLRIVTFQIGSAMGDIIVTSIWNRAMVSTFGISAGLVGFLIALRYLLAPLGIIAGFASDRRRFLGSYRTSYVWLGRALMLVALPLLALSLARFGVSRSDAIGWASAAASALLYGVGTLLSGGPFLALVRESVPQQRQGFAISMSETALIVCFALVGIGFSILLPNFSQSGFRVLVLITMVSGAFFWCFSIVGVESRVRSRSREAQGESKPKPLGSAAESAAPGFMTTIAEIWSDRRTRGFFLFLFLATLAAWAQDAILEPFGGDAFGLSFGETTRFNSYWQTATVLTLLIGGFLWRKRAPEEQSGIAQSGLWVMGSGMAGLAGIGIAGGVGGAAAWTGHLIPLALLLFGAGFGIYTFGGLSLMAVMSPDRNAGTYLGLWSIAVLLSKGLGTFLGGVLRDLFLHGAGLPPGAAYGAVFALEAVALVSAALVLRPIDIHGFARDAGRGISREEAQIAAADT